MTAALLAAHVAGAASFLIWVIVALLLIACVVWVLSMLLPGSPVPAIVGVVLLVLFLLWLLA